MKITRVAAGDYERYEFLILQKEQLEKEAEQAELEYMRLFGDLITESFSLKVDCIALKKEIALYVRAKNGGKPVDPAAVAETLRSQMTAYRLALASMIEKKKEAEKAVLIDPADTDRIKKIYRRLARMLHPDVSTLTEKIPELNGLFIRATAAYRANDLKEIRKIEVLINKVLEENGIDRLDLYIPDLEKRIEELEEEIDALVGSEPYTYRLLLKSDAGIRKKKKELKDEIASYRAYKDELSEKLGQLKKEVPHV